MAATPSGKSPAGVPRERAERPAGHLRERDQSSNQEHAIRIACTRLTPEVRLRADQINASAASFDGPLVSSNER